MAFGKERIIFLLLLYSLSVEGENSFERCHHVHFLNGAHILGEFPLSGIELRLIEVSCHVDCMLLMG